MPMNERPEISRTNLRLMAAILAGASILGFAAASGHAADEPAVKSPAAKRGDALFHQRCAVCHNKQPDDNTPFGPPNLYQVFRHKVLTVAQATEVIHKGKGPMPAFGDSITNSQIRDVVAYLSSH
jgi:mono/diheme cytochrome c family protein